MEADSYFSAGYRLEIENSKDGGQNYLSGDERYVKDGISKVAGL